MTRTPTPAVPAGGLELTVLVYGEIVDLIAVERVIAGQPPKPQLTRVERLAVVRRLVDDGHGPSMVARRLGVSGDSARRLVESVRAGAARRAGRA